MRRSPRLPLLTLKRASRLLASGLITSEELCTYCHFLARAGEEQWQLNAFTSIVPYETILGYARASDKKRRDDKSNVSPLEGIPVSVKANLAVSDQPLTAGSGVLSNETPCGYDADVVSKLVRESGAILMGVTNMDEFGMGSLGANAVASPTSGLSVTRNPLPYLRHLHSQRDVLSDCDDDRLVDFIRMPVDSIIEAHLDASEKEKDSPIRSAGGSSCGSAASVAHGSSLASLGTDTGGSVRLPSAWCGTVGLKPSYGILSRHGVVSYASSLDTVGILAPSVDCATMVFDQLAQRQNSDGSRDSTASFHEPSFSLADLVDNDSPEPLSGIKIGMPAAFSVEECPQSIQDAWGESARRLQEHGATVMTVSTDVVSPEIVQKSLAAYYVLASAEASSNLSRYDGLRYGPPLSDANQADGPSTTVDMTPLEVQYSATRTKGFGTEVIRRILCGTSVLSSDRFHTHYEAAAKLRAVLTQQLHGALQEVDLLLIPTAVSLPCSLDEQPDSTEMFANDVMTVPVSLAGLPAISVPVDAGASDDFPTVGMQLVGSRLDERTVLKVAKVVEQVGQ